MASGSGSDEDPDLESLRSAVLASLKTKTGGTTSQGQSDGNVTKSEEKENEDEEEKQNEHPEDEEDLHALRLAALKSKRDDSVPKAAPTTFERKGNLISIQIVDPEEERRKAEEERKAKAQANAPIDPELSKAAKPARFRRFDSSDSENDEEEEDERRDIEESEDEKSIDSSSSSSSSKSEGSVSSKSSDSSSSESEKDSKSSSSSESESEGDEKRNKQGKQEESSQPDARRKRDGHIEVKDKVKREQESKERFHSSEGRNKDETSTKETRSVKDRLGVRLPEEQRSMSDKKTRSSGQGSRTTERGRDGYGRDDRRQRSDSRQERRQNDRAKVNSHPSSSDRRSQRTTEGRGDRYRSKGHSGDLRDRLRHEKERKDSHEKDHRTRSVEHSSSRREGTHESSKRIPNEVTSRTHDRPRTDRRRDTARNSRTDTRQVDAEKNNKYTDRKTYGKDPGTRNSSNSKNEKVGDVSQKLNVQNSKKASDSESLSDIPLESEEEKEDSDSENVRFRKGRHEVKSEKTENEVESNSQSRIVMSLQLLTESELKKADDKISKDFKRRRNMDGHGIDNSKETLKRGSGKIDLRTLDRRPRNSERRGQGSPDRTSRPRARETYGRRKPRPSDFVSESESEEEDKSGAALRSQVSGAGDAGKRERNFSKSKSSEKNVNKDDKIRDSKTERDERRRRERRERREKRSKRRVVEEKSGSHATDEENGEEAVKQLSIRDRLGERPVSGLRSSIKSRLGPKVSPSSPADEREDSEVLDRPKAKVRKIEVSYRDSDHNVEGHLDDLGSFEETVEKDEKIVTKPDDLRHKMKRQLHKEEDQSPEEVVQVKRKVMKNNVWAEVLLERSSKEGRGESSSPHRGGSREREGKEKRQETKKEEKKKEKKKEDEILDAKIKRIKEMNAAILERQKQIQKEKELFGS